MQALNPEIFFFLQPMQGEDDDGTAIGAIRVRFFGEELKNTGRCSSFRSFFPIPFDFFEADGYIMQVYVLMYQKTHTFTS